LTIYIPNEKIILLMKMRSRLKQKSLTLHILYLPHKE